MIAKWNGVAIAESDDIVMVEGNAYFPPSSLCKEYFVETAHHTVCPWKGTASYYSVTVDGETNENAAWYYPDPKPAAADLGGRVAFWKGVTVE